MQVENDGNCLEEISGQTKTLLMLSVRIRS